MSDGIQKTVYLELVIMVRWFLSRTLITMTGVDWYMYFKCNIELISSVCDATSVAPELYLFTKVGSVQDCNSYMNHEALRLDRPQASLRVFYFCILFAFIILIKAYRGKKQALEPGEGCCMPR